MITTSRHKDRYFLIPDGVEDERVFISCIRGAYCSLESFLGDRLRTTYKFDENYLSEWKTIKNSMDELLTGFTKTYCW